MMGFREALKAMMKREKLKDCRDFPAIFEIFDDEVRRLGWNQDVLTG